MAPLMSFNKPCYPPTVNPTTVDELARVVGGYSTDIDAGYGMFWCMRGLPRAYMDLPTRAGVERFTYSVIGFESAFPRGVSEPKLVLAMYKFLVALRVRALRVYDQEDTPDKNGDLPIPPILLVRRDLEFQFEPDTEKVRFTYRIALPGVNLAAYDIYRVPGQVTYTQVDANAP